MPPQIEQGMPTGFEPEPDKVGLAGAPNAKPEPHQSWPEGGAQEMSEPNTDGRKANAAQPLGERRGTSSRAATERVGKAEQKSAGPDGPRAEDVGRTFKKPGAP